MAKSRPSSLQLAELCDRAPWLGHRYREGNAATEGGIGVDVDISGAIRDGTEPQTPEGRLLLEWLRSKFKVGAEFHVQRRVQIIDPLTGEELTGGTPDLLVHVPMFRKLWVVDWKSKGQMFAGHLAKADENLQQLSYGIGAAMEFGVDEFQIILACFDEKGVTPLESQPYAQADWWPVIERIRAIPDFDPEGPEPEATTGEHCRSCWNRSHCSAHMLPAMKDTPVALVPFTEGHGELTADQAAAGLEWLARAKAAIKTAEEVKETVEESLKAFALQNGPIRVGDREWGPIPTNGKRRGPKFEELEAAGLGHLIKPGEPGVKFDWKKAG